MKSGVHTMPATEYHNLSDQIYLSASIAKILIQSSPLHAWAAHPLLNPDYIREDAKHFDLGTIAHALLLEGADVAHVIQATNKEGEIVSDYRTKAAQTERDEARAAGKYPILAHELPAVTAMIAACSRQLNATPDFNLIFTAGRPELTLIWQEFNGVYCKARLDWLSDSFFWIDDYKTTSGSAHPDQIARNMFRDGWDIQAAFYIRGVKACCSVTPQFRFVVQETFTPYALSVLGLNTDALGLANEKVERAIDVFGKCLNSGQWPGYPAFVCAAELPAWENHKWVVQLEQ